MTRRSSKRMRDATARRKQIESPPRHRAADARAASQRQAGQSAAGTDRGMVTCGWCSANVPVPSRGRVPKWCSASCRHRAWEQRRAAASGLSALEVVDRPVEVVRTATKIKRVVVDGRPIATPRTVEEWARLLEELASRLDRGTIYDRQLPSHAPSRHRPRRLLRPPMELTSAMSQRPRTNDRLAAFGLVDAPGGGASCALGSAV